MQSSRYIGEINPVTIGIEMRQCFNTYSRKMILNIAESQFWAREKLEEIKDNYE